MAAMPVRPNGRDEFYIAIICALSLEAEMVELMLDKDWTDDGPSFSKAHGDSNVYTTGVLAGHNVVLCYMPSMGGNNAAACATAVRISFSNIKIAFVVGVCGVIPRNPHTGENIMLGDCIISTSVTQYDFGRQHPDGFSAKVSIDDSLSRASPEIRSMMSKLSTRLNTRKLTDKLLVYLRDLQQRESDVRYPGANKDCLFRSDYDHGQHLPNKICTYCGKDTTGACSKDCREIKCDQTFAVPRPVRNSTAVTAGKQLDHVPKVYFGRVGSANMVIKAGLLRDKIAKQHDVIAFEMESSGVWEVLPTIVIKAACDYADSHKNKDWQQWAAAVAASCLKALLARWEEFEAKHTVIDNVLRNEYRDVNPPMQEMALVMRKIDTNDSKNVLLKTRSEILEELDVSGADGRVNNIRSGHSATCHWLVEHKLYLDWLNDDQYSVHPAILWIKGKAGSGKSTIMKYILTEGMSQHMMSRNEDKTYQDVIVSFFINARGTELEKTTVGLYRSLLAQLFTQIPDMQEILDNQTLNSLSHGLNLEILERVLCLAVQWIGRRFLDGKCHYRVLCFIDALDECPEDQVRDMLRLFEGLYATSLLHNVHASFRLCISSRHYPSISVEYCQHLFLEDQLGHLDDIWRYVDAELRLGPSDEAEAIKAEMVEKSGQIFLWVVLVVQMMKKENDHGRIHVMRKKLRDIPKELNELFKDIVLRDQDNVEDLILCLQWILYAKRPLFLDELYFAMLWGIDPTNSALVIPWQSNQVGHEEMQRYVLSSSKGLAEFAYSDHAQFPFVQFIHESVREFFIKEQTLVSSWFEHHDIVAGDSHDRLKIICHQQIGSIDDYRNGLVQRFPFLNYAVANIMWHAEQACACGISQIKFLEHLPLKHLLELTDTLQCDQYEISPETSLLNVLAHRDHPHLISEELIQNPTSNRLGDETLGDPMYMALYAGNVAAVMVLLKPAPGPGVDAHLFEQAVNSACSLIQWNPPQESQSPISWLDQHASDELVKSLLVCKDWVDLQACTDLLHMATRHQDIDVVQDLLQFHDIQVDTYNYEGCTPLYVAACQGFTELVQCFIANKASIEKGLLKGRHTESPLLVAAKQGHREIFHILLDHQADPLAKNKKKRNALHLVGYTDDATMVKRLLGIGSKQSLDMDTRDRNGWLPIHVAASRGSLSVLDLLLTSTVSIDIQTTDSTCTALWLAARNGHWTAVQHLIKRNASVEIVAQGNHTVLHAAVASQSRRSVKLLLDAGADIHAETSEFFPPWCSASLLWGSPLRPENMQPLHIAMLNIDLPMVELLMNSGAVLADDIDGIDVCPFLSETLIINEIDWEFLGSLQERVKHRTERGWPILKAWLQRLANLNDYGPRRDV